MAGSIRSIKFIRYYEKFDKWKQKTKAIVRHKETLKYLAIKWEIPKEEHAEDDEDILKIYEGNIKAQGLLIIILSDITCDLARECNDNSDGA